MISCLVLDDEQHAIDLLETHIKQVPFLNLVFTANSSSEALQFLSANKVDLIFTDIQMPDITGLDFIRSLPQKPQFILTTAYSEFAIEGFELDALDYLLKPITFPRFLKAAHKAFNAITSKLPAPLDDIQEDYLFVKTEHKGKMIKINFDDIDYIEGMKNYVGFCRGKEKTLALLTMKHLEETLPKNRFIRIHYSFIIAKDRIAMIEGNQVVLKNSQTKLPIGVTYKDAFFEAMHIKK